MPKIAFYIIISDKIKQYFGDDICEETLSTLFSGYLDPFTVEENSNCYYIKGFLLESLEVSIIADVKKIDVFTEDNVKDIREGVDFETYIYNYILLEFRKVIPDFEKNPDLKDIFSKDIIVYRLSEEEVQTFNV